MLRVYYAPIPDTVWEADVYPLSAYRRERLAAVKAPQLRGQMIAAELLLNQAVREFDPGVALPLDIGTGRRGKPFLKNLPLCFSLSHSGTYAACAIADFEIGLDIQKRTPAKEALVKRYFSEEERRYLRQSSDSDNAFTEIWCLKESYVKALGTGLRTPFSTFSISLGSRPVLRDDPDVRFWRYETESFQLSVCALNGREPIPEFVQKEELARL